MADKMTPSRLKKLSTATLKRIAYGYQMMVPRDYSKQDIVDLLADRMGEDPVAWTLLGQYVEECY